MSVFRHLSRPALATFAVAATLGGVAAGASAQAAPMPSVKAQSTEFAELAPWVASGPGTGSVGTFELPGTPRYMLYLQLGLTGSYSDVHFSTSSPGSAKGCSDVARLTRDRAITCPVTLPPLKPNEERTYTVTLTGKHNGVAFRRTLVKKLKATPVTARVWVNNMEATGQTAHIKAGTTARVMYQVRNNSTITLKNLQFFTGDGGAAATCTIATLAPGATAAFQFTLKQGDPLLSDTQVGHVQRFPGMVADGPAGWRGWLDLNPGRVVFVK